MRKRNQKPNQLSAMQADETRIYEFIDYSRHRAPNYLDAARYLDLGTITLEPGIPVAFNTFQVWKTAPREPP